MGFRVWELGSLGFEASLVTSVRDTERISKQNHAQVLQCEVTADFRGDATSSERVQGGV